MGIPAIKIIFYHEVFKILLLTGSAPNTGG